MVNSRRLSQTPALILFLLVYITICSPIEQARHEPRCSNITIPVTISSKNADLPSGFSFGTPDAAEVVTKLKFNVSIHSTYNIAATFCEPEVFVPTRVNTLQFLVHGATYTRSYVKAFPIHFSTFRIHLTSSSGVAKASTVTNSAGLHMLLCKDIQLSLSIVSEMAFPIIPIPSQ
jgi:hypothetical protein